MPETPPSGSSEEELRAALDRVRREGFGSPISQEELDRILESSPATLLPDGPMDRAVREYREQSAREELRRMRDANGGALSTAYLDHSWQAEQRQLLEAFEAVYCVNGFGRDRGEVAPAIFAHPVFREMTRLGQTSDYYAITTEFGNWRLNAYRHPHQLFPAADIDIAANRRERFIADNNGIGLADGTSMDQMTISNYDAAIAGNYDNTIRESPDRANYIRFSSSNIPGDPRRPHDEVFLVLAPGSEVDLSRHTREHMLNISGQDNATFVFGENTRGVNVVINGPSSPTDTALQTRAVFQVPPDMARQLQAEISVVRPNPVSNIRAGTPTDNLPAPTPNSNNISLRLPGQNVSMSVRGRGTAEYVQLDPPNIDPLRPDVDAALTEATMNDHRCLPIARTNPPPLQGTLRIEGRNGFRDVRLTNDNGSPAFTTAEALHEELVRVANIVDRLPPPPRSLGAQR